MLCNLFLFSETEEIILKALLSKSKVNQVFVINYTELYFSQ